MSENIHQQNIVNIIEREIVLTQEEIKDVGNIVKGDIERLLAKSVENIQEKEKQDFLDKHFESLKNEKLNSLKQALKKFQDLKDSFLIECEECQECKNV